MESVTFDSSDVGQVEAFVSQIYSKMRIGAVGESTRARISRRVLTPEVGFDDLDYSFDIGYSAHCPDLIIICDVISSTIRRDGEGSSDTFGPGEQFLISQPGLPYAGVAHATRLQFTLIDPVTLTRVAASANGQGGPVRLLDYRPVSPAAAQQLRACTAYLREVMEFAGRSRAPALIASAASRFLAAAVLNAYSNTTLTDPATEDRHDAHPETVRRAVAFIDEHAHEDITVVDVAAAFVTTRAVQLAFRRHLDTTPMRYLRRVRLDHAHHDLADANPDHESVAAIAYRWSFSNQSRFATAYRQAYGTLPSETLRS